MARKKKSETSSVDVDPLEAPSTTSPTAEGQDAFSATPADFVSDLDDGAVEVVDGAPQRKRPQLGEVEDAAKLAAGGRMAAMREAGAAQARADFIRVRSKLGSVQISIHHLPVFDALWSIWARKRAEGEEDPGVTKTELVAETGLELPKAQHILDVFRRTGVVRSILTHVGWRGTRSRYYPTDEGIFAFGLAEVLGHGSAVQVGHQAKAWRDRSNTEPRSIFQWATFYRGGVDPESLTSE